MCFACLWKTRLATMWMTTSFDAWWISILVCISAVPTELLLSPLLIYPNLAFSGWVLSAGCCRLLACCIISVLFVMVPSFACPGFFEDFPGLVLLALFSGLLVSCLAWGFPWAVDLSVELVWLSVFGTLRSVVFQFLCFLLVWSALVARLVGVVLALSLGLVGLLVELAF